MRSKTLSTILKEISYQFCQDPGNTKVTGIVYDSREVQKGYAFFALKGLHTDGHHYIDKAIEAGASVIVYSDKLEDFRDGTAYVHVEDTRKALAPFSASFYDHPSRELSLVGVTGTDGKSTTVSLISQLLTMQGLKTGHISTVSFNTGSKEQKNYLRQSTPEAPEIQRLLREMVDKGLDYAVIEATSHGLSEKNFRLGCVDFDAAVFTNITQEHLEFHGTLEQYKNDKANLFRMIADSENEMAFGVVNIDDEAADYFIEALGEKPFFSYSMDSEDADLHVKNIDLSPEGTEFRLCYPGGSERVRLNIPGKVNIENLMAALITVMELEGLDVEDLLDSIPSLKGVDGRMVSLEGSQPFQVYVDYAHTPGSFNKLLPSLKKETRGKLISVFGSAGERDIDKRSQQGKIADQHCDIIILTDEDPRLEDSMKILEDIASGTVNRKRGENLFLIPDRREALSKALELAGEGDTVIGLGKGHESSIIYAEGPREWNEEKVLTELLREKGY